VKRLIISISILLLVFCTLTLTFAETTGKAAEPVEKQKELTGAESPEKAQADANAITEPNMVDANAVMIEDLKKEVEPIDKQGDQEVREWLRGDIEGRVNLARAADKQAVEELNFLRKIAVEEKAEKTTQAIDFLLAGRKERFDKIIAGLEDERKKERLREREEKRREREERRARARSQQQQQQ
jgi:hypothetical protein